MDSWSNSDTFRPMGAARIYSGFLKKCYIFCFLNTFGKFLFGNVLFVVNVIVVMAVSSLEKGLINQNIGKEILKTF